MPDNDDFYKDPMFVGVDKAISSPWPKAEEAPKAPAFTLTPGEPFDLRQAYRGNLKWLAERTIYVTRHGSHAYGTSTPESDLDLRGIAIAPPGYYLGFRDHFEQAESKDPDLVIFDIQKFFQLAADNNPNALEILFTDPSDHLLTTPAFDLLFERRKLFLSRLAKHRLSGYAISQLKRINTHYRWLKNPPKAPPTRSEFGLPERTLIPRDQLEAAQAAVDKQLDRWNFHGLEHVDPATRVALQNSLAELLAEIKVNAEDLPRAAARAIGYDENFIELLDRERHYQGRQKEWTSYQTWLRTRNPKRAAIEEKYGYDCKHGMHLVRLMWTCRDLLTTGEYVVRRPDADVLLMIRNGYWTYEQILDFAKKEDETLSELMKTSILPKVPDRETLHELCVRLIRETMGADSAHLFNPNLFLSSDKAWR